eukprot:TRINITY_DN6190_c0_g1_i1.p1 TRINITY_DN6190_c0_g1~~TRINITY_DN6190_c0_g1_i1.p1  ORF type:complete len:131 (+),score=12.06 TRINITY_DN6190_c0_g1_i1:53-445(+)
MISVLNNYLPLLGVALLWGTSNPFMKRGSKGITEIQKTNSQILNFFLEFKFLFLQPLYVLAFLVNICGSVLFYYSMSNQDISIVVPISNSLTFLITTITSKLLGEEGINNYTYVGMIFVLLGVSLCVSSS